MRGKMATCYIYGAMPCGSTEKLEEGDLLIAADGGYAYLQGQKPDLVVGDFDSLGYVPEGEQIIRHPVQKDDTDMLLAVREGLKRGYWKFVLYGGIGGRLDHTIANIQVLAFLREQGCQAVLYGEKEEVHLLRNETLTFSAGRKGLLSVFSFEKEARGVTLSGLAYELTDAVLTNTFPIGTSNEFIGTEAQITVADGSLLVICERD